VKASVKNTLRGKTGRPDSLRIRDRFAREVAAGWGRWGVPAKTECVVRGVGHEELENKLAEGWRCFVILG
jgi:hypothetical protein